MVLDVKNYIGALSHLCQSMPVIPRLLEQKVKKISYNSHNKLNSGQGNVMSLLLFLLTLVPLTSPGVGSISHFGEKL